MKSYSLLIVLLAVSLRITLAQNGYNYDRPDVNLGGSGGARPPTGSGFQPAQGGGYPTTPTYAAPSFSPNQPTGTGQNGYNYPSQADTDFPTAPASGTTGYPSGGPQRPGANVGSPASSYGPPQAGQAGTFAAGQPARPGFGQASGPSGFGQQGSISGPGGFQGGVISGSSSSSGSSGSGQQDESQEGDYSAIPGEPEKDYPIYSEIPETSFDCSQQEFPGYYADVEARCQVFHICALNKTFNFLCPNGTIFSQESLVCVWWNLFDCDSAPGLFGNNANLYDNSQQGAAQGGAQGGVSNDFGATGPYPAPGRPQSPSFGASAPTGPNNYQPSAPSAGNYPAAPTGSAGGYQPPSIGPSSPQGPYPSAQIPPSNVPSSYQPPQGDTSYPAAGVPQQTTPSRDYLPPRRG